MALVTKQAVFASVAAVVLSTMAHAQDSCANLAKKLSNPIASLISVPFQFNYDHGYGPLDGGKSTLNIQPVIPISSNEDWNPISRTILPVTYQYDVAGPSDPQFGLGDVLEGFFLSPAKPKEGGLIWGAGPVFLIPTATDDLLGSESWGAGPTVVALKQDGRWTRGQQRPNRHQQYLPAAVPVLHHAGCPDVRLEHGIHLRLEGEGMVRAHQPYGLETGEGQRAANQLDLLGVGS